MIARWVVAAALAAALLLPATGAAYDPGFDPSTLRQVACGAAPEWCGMWTPDPPQGTVPSVAFGPITLQGVDPAAAAATAGRPHPAALLGTAHIPGGELLADRLLSPLEVQAALPRP